MPSSAATPPPAIMTLIGTSFIALIVARCGPCIVRGFASPRVGGFPHGFARAVDHFSGDTRSGIAAVEGLLRLRRFAGDAVDVTLLAPNEELRLPPVAVQEPFSRPSAKRYPAERCGAEGRRRVGAGWARVGGS